MPQASPGAPVAPDPFQPVLPPPGPAHTPQRVRRAAILAATRRLLAEGPDQFTLRRVAEECGVTVQTIRNGFGRREDLLVSALNEHTSAVWAVLGAIASGPVMFLELANMYHSCAVATPGFLRGMVTAAIANTHPLTALQRHGVTLKTDHLRVMASRGLLRGGTDAAALAAQITRLNTFMMYEWAMGGDADGLREQMIAGNRLLIAGAAHPSVLAEIEAWSPALHEPAIST